MRLTEGGGLHQADGGLGCHEVGPQGGGVWLCRHVGVGNVKLTRARHAAPRTEWTRNAPVLRFMRLSSPFAPNSALQTRSRAALGETRLANGLGLAVAGHPSTSHVCWPAAWPTRRIRADARKRRGAVFILS